jgi:flavin-dependent dehydrogenase
MTTWDVAVIGAGVAGSATATLLAKAGLGVILLDKGTWPRHKVCGEFVSPEGADVLRRLGVWQRIEAHSPPLVQSFVLTAGGQQARRHLPLPGWGVSRWILDRTLWEHAQAAGVVAWAHSDVTQVMGGFGGGFTLRLRRPGRPAADLRARAVVCAAGRLWRSGRAGGAERSRRGPRFVGLKAYFRGVSLDTSIELHVVQEGYCGLMRVTDGLANLCCWVRAEALRRAGGTPVQFLAAAMRQNAHLRRRLAEAERLDMPWITVSHRYHRRPIPVVNAVWHVGDSAAMVAPLTGDGMGMGLRAAELAAPLLGAACRRALSWQEATGTYRQRWQHAFGPRLRWGKWLEMVLLRPRLAALACMALNLMPALVDAMYHRTRDINPGAPHVGKLTSC